MITNRRNSFISSFKKDGKFFAKMAFLFWAVAFFCFAIVMPQYSHNYTAGLIDKVERLKTVQGSKIVLIGNSNLSFGIHSEEIEREFSMPVVNMGMYGSFGNAFHEEMARLNVKKGDIYIICHSNFCHDKKLRDYVLIWSAIENHFGLWRLLRSDDIVPLIRAYPIYLKKCLELYISGEGNLRPEGCYSRDAFNAYGDIAIERTKSEWTFEEPVTPPEIDQTAIRRINQLAEWLQERGAVLLVAGYPIGKGDLTAPEEDFLMAQEELKERLSCPFISDCRDYMFDYGLFYNTDLHLTDEGATLRTQQLISDLKEWMGSQKAS